MNTKPESGLGMEAFFTRTRANEGIDIPLVLPDGTRSEHWIKIRGVDSDEFRLADAAERRKGMEIAMMESTLEKAVAIEEAKTSLIASLIISWSFEQECTTENIKKLLREAPQISDAIDTVASRRSLFFERKSAPSKTTPPPSSDLTSSLKEASNPSEQV